MSDKLFQWVSASFIDSLCVYWESGSKQKSAVKEREWERNEKARNRDWERNDGKNSFKKKTFSSFPQTPLHFASDIGSVESVNTLIKFGADVTAKNVRSERECESASHRRRDVWGYVWFTDGCLFGCGGVVTYAELGKIYLSHFFS